MAGAAAPTTAPRPAGAPADRKYTLADVIAEGDKHDAKLRDLIFRKARESALLARGQRAATEDILDAAPDFFSAMRATWAHLAPEQRGKIVGYTPAYDAILGYEVGVLAKMNRTFDASSTFNAADRAKKKAVARAKRSMGVKLRKQAVYGLRVFTDDEEALEVMIGKGTAETYQSLEAGLLHTADLIGIHRADPEVANALDQTGLTEEFIARLRAVAAEVRQSGEEADAVNPAARVTQRQLDIQDGRVLHLLRIIDRAFSVGNEIDEAIVPLPLGALAVVFDKKSRRASGGEAADDGEGTDGDGEADGGEGTTDKPE